MIAEILETEIEEEFLFSVIDMAELLANVQLQKKDGSLKKGSEALEVSRSFLFFRSFIVGCSLIVWICGIVFGNCVLF